MGKTALRNNDRLMWHKSTNETVIFASKPHQSIIYKQSNCFYDVYIICRNHRHKFVYTIMRNENSNNLNQMRWNNGRV